MVGFVNLPETHRSRFGEELSAEKMKKAVWLRPEVVAQIEFLEWTDADRLRHSKFVGLREDKDPRSVTKTPCVVGLNPHSRRSRSAKRSTDCLSARSNRVKPQPHNRFTWLGVWGRRAIHSQAFSFRWVVLLDLPHDLFRLADRVDDDDLPRRARPFSWT
jgi:ATP dependent DNA ligase C terminal region